MPRDVTVSFGDGSKHVYNGVPDDAQPQSVMDRAGKDFSGKQITNIDGGKSAAPAPAQAVERLPAAYGVPTFDTSGKERAKGIRETITGPDTGTQQEWFKKQQGIESTLRSQGKTDEQISQDPGWQEAARNLSRSVSAGATQTAIGETGGAGAVAGLVKGATVAAKPVVGMVRNAVGKESAAAARELAGEAKSAVGQLISGEQKSVATQKAVDAATSGRPGATVLQVEKSLAPDAAKLTQARVAAQSANRELSEATTKLQAAQRNLSGMDKYAGQARSEPMVRSARRELNRAQAAVNRLTLSRDEAEAARKEIEAAHKETLKSAKSGERQEAASAKKIASDAAKSEGRIMSLQKLSAELNAAKEPADIAGSARKVGEQMLRAKKMTPEQYTEYLRRIDTMIDKSKSTKEARDQFVKLLKASGLLGIGAAGGSYAIRTFH